MAKAPAAKPDTPAVTVLDAAVTFEKLAEFAYLGTLITEITEARSALMETFKPLGLPHFGKLAAQATDAKTMGKTFKIVDGAVEASLQLRASNGALKPASASLLSLARLPLEQIASVECINGDYALNHDVIKRLKTLIAAHPEAMIPSDFFSMTASAIAPKQDGSTLFKALTLSPDVRAKVIPLLATTVVVGATGDAPDAVKAAVRARFLSAPVTVEAAEPVVSPKASKKKQPPSLPAPAPVVAEPAARAKKGAHLKLVATEAEPVPVARAGRAKAAAKEMARPVRRQA